MFLNGSAVAYIDGANLYRGIRSSGWRLDYRRFRLWMQQKYGVAQAKLFIGHMPEHAALYASFLSDGYQCVFKEVVYDGMGNAKGNCDADLVLQAVRDAFEGNAKQVILVSSDGDYAPLIRFWQEKKIPCVVLSPSPIKRCSILLKRTGVPIISLQGPQRKIQRLK